MDATRPNFMSDRRLALFLTFLFLAPLFIHGGETRELRLAEAEPSQLTNDPWNLSTVGDVAIPEGFTFLSYIDYSDVGVLINNESEVSKQIGYAFVQARNISPDRIFLFDNESTPTGETINPDQFDQYFAEPLRMMLSDRNLSGTLNYLVTTKGIPLRVNGPGDGKAAFDQEIGLVDGIYNASIHQNWWDSHTYGPGAGEEMKQFSRTEEGFYLVTRLNGYTVETALGLIEKANNSFGSRGGAVLDLATNRNGSGYKWWNDMLYDTNTTMNGTMGLPVHFNQNSTFVTNQTDIMFYASWGSNDGSWDQNWLPNSGFDSSDSSWSTGSKYWTGVNPPVNIDESFSWNRQTAIKRNGNAAIEGAITSAPCTQTTANQTNGLLAEYFDNAGVSYNSSTMPDLTGRTPDFTRVESTINWPATLSTWTGLDSRFLDYWSVRYTGAIDVPTAGNWTFYLRSDDGTVLWIDGVEAASNRGVHGMSETSNTIWLDAGKHHLRTEFFEHGGYAGFQLYWSGPGINKQIIPANALFRGDGKPPTNQSLLHHWAFDETAGTNAADTALSSNLTFFGTNNGSGWTNCLFGNCYEFDGVDDYAKVDVQDWGGAFTVSLWVKTDNVNQSRHSSAIAVNDVAGDSNSFQIQASGGANGDWEVYHNVSYSFGEMPLGDWTNLVVTFANSTVTQFMDGVQVRMTQVPNGTIDSIELYKFGVNRAGNAYFEGMIDDVRIWNRTLNSTEIGDIANDMAISCPSYSGSGSATAAVSQDYDFEDDLKSHAWIVYGYAMKEGWVNGDWWIEVDGLDTNGTVLSTNISSSRELSTSWESRTMRFRPDANATMFEVRMVNDFDNVTINGSVFFDTMNLRAIRPHFDWVDGSIAETAVSTGGRSFAWGTNYGQSLVADLLEDGVSGVKGYVYEPYLSAVGYPSILLPYYAYGYNFAEVNYAANPMISWMGTVVGDPKMSPYADILHDVNLSAVRTNGTLSIGVNGSLELLVENLAPGEVNGYIEVRDRIGNTLMANHTLQMPSGDSPGSRQVISVNITPTRVGFNEYIIVYRSLDWLKPERVISNNVKTLNFQVNQPPVAESLLCSTWVANRGDTIGCTMTTSDDFYVDRVRLGWRLNSSGESWEFINATTTDQIQWYVPLKIPTNIPLGSLDLISEVRDAQNQIDHLLLESAVQVNDAPQVWFGVHVDGIDIANWNDVTHLQPMGDTSLVRDRNYTLRACVDDPDHDPATQLPMIISTQGQATQVVPTESIFEDISCYEAIWRTEWGGSKEPIDIDLFDSDGLLHTTRRFSVHDEPFQLDIELVDSEGIKRYLAHGTHPPQGEMLSFTISDVDDPLSEEYSFTWEATWPGHDPVGFSAEMGGSSIPNSQWTLAAPPPGLEAGILEVTVTITDEDSKITQIFDAEWPIHLQSTEVFDVFFCDLNEFELNRGVSYLGLVQFSPHRSVDTMSLMVSQDGTLSQFGTKDVNSPEFEGCMVNDSSGISLMGFEITLSNQFTRGDATLSVMTTDEDGLRGSTDFPMTILFSEPTVVNQYGDPVEGKLGIMGATISDPDGHDGTTCTFLILNDNGSTVMESEGALPNHGLYEANWMPPTTGAPFTSTIGCTDAQGNQVANTRTGIMPASPPEGDKSENQTKVEGETDDEMGTTIMIITGIILLFIVIISATAAAVKIMRTDDDIEQDADDGSSSVWSAPTETREEGEVNVALHEMAMSILGQEQDELVTEETVETLESEELEEDSSLDWVDESLALGDDEEPKP